MGNVDWPLLLVIGVFSVALAGAARLLGALSRNIQRRIAGHDGR